MDFQGDHVTFRFRRNPDIAGDKEVKGQKQIQLVDNTTNSHRYCWSECRRPKSKGPDNWSLVALWKTQAKANLDQENKQERQRRQTKAMLILRYTSTGYSL